VLAALVAGVSCGGASGRPGAPAAGEGKGIEAAALPYRVLRARGGQEVAWDDFLAELGAADAVCIGEHHPNPHDHWAQFTIVDQLTRRARAAGRGFGLGMEMFQRPFQGVLDDFGAGRIDEVALLGRSGWAERWGYDWELYQPIVRVTRERGGVLLALNTERELTKKVSREGLGKLAPADRERLPELVLDDADHRSWWDEIMGAMGGAHGHGAGDGAEKDEQEQPGRPAGELDPEAAAAAAQSERIYTAQVLWDETMADRAAAWLVAGQGRFLVILAGNGHCHESAIVRRLERRGVREAISIRPIIDDGDGKVASLLAAPENDYLFVMTAR
jgi:uncharacterized iron-regulated protein